MKIPLDRSNPRSLVVPVRVYGPEGQRWSELVAAVDTGASAVMIPREVARALGYRLDGAEPQRVVAGNTVFYPPKIVLARMDVLLGPHRSQTLRARDA